MLNEEDTRKIWSNCKTFSEVCDVMARFVRGDLACSPGHLAPPDSETKSIELFLDAFNRIGFLTTDSQPGDEPHLDPDGTFSAQRAFVCGYCNDKVADRFKRLALTSNLIVLLYPPRSTMHVWVPVTISSSQPSTAVGPNTSEEESTRFAEFCNASIGRALTESWSITVVDPVWGRKKTLWSEISRALARAFDPSIDGGPNWPDFLPSGNKGI